MEQVITSLVCKHPTVAAVQETTLQQRIHFK